MSEMTVRELADAMNVDGATIINWLADGRWDYRHDDDGHIQVTVDESVLPDRPTE